MPQPTTPTATATEQSPGAVQIERAKRLEFERGELMEKIGKNRAYLRLMADNEVLSPEETKWVNTFYPEKEKGERRSEDDIEATRKLREEARKGNKPSAEAAKATTEAAKAA